MARGFNLDPNAAREANVGGKRITDTGKYIGTITVAFYESNQNGTESVNIMFKSDAGQEAGPLNIYTHNGSGQELSGYKLVNAIMTCCQVRSLSTKLANVDLYDFDTKAMVTKQKEVYQELTGKKIGFVLQQEEYEKRDNSVGTRLIVAAPFEAGTERMAIEILDKKQQPEQLGRLMEYIAKSPIRKLRNQRSGAATGNGYGSQPPAGYDDFDDSIPFS